VVRLIILALALSAVGCVSQATAQRQEVEELTARLDTISCNELAVAVGNTHYRDTKVAIARLQIAKGCEVTAIPALEEDARRFERRTLPSLEPFQERTIIRGTRDAPPAR
jgi:hypothetical protein